MNTTTNSRLTFTNALRSGKPSILAEVLLKQGRSIEEVEQMNSVLQSAATIAVNALREHQRKNQERLEQENKDRTQKEQMQSIIKAKAQEAIKAAKESLIETLIVSGVEKHKAHEMAEREFSNVYPMGKITIQYKGKTFETSEKGKASAELREVMDLTGFTRKQVIQHFSV